MTKKDYILIASCIADSIEYADIPFILADKLATTNPRFNREKFLKACAVEIENIMWNCGVCGTKFPNTKEQPRCPQCKTEVD